MVDEPPDTIDPLARAGVLAIACARIGIGIGAVAFTRPALAGLGLDADATAVALARLAGGRDIALGAHALAALGDRRRLREATALAALVDLGDAIAFGAGARAAEIPRRSGVLNAAAGGAAAIAGLWVLRRL